jgi:hypothetical protein
MVARCLKRKTKNLNEDKININALLSLSPKHEQIVELMNPNATL